MKEIENILNNKYENHVLPFLWQKGESQDIIQDYLRKIHESDIHEICIESRPHPDFAGEKWWSDIDFIVNECKKLGVKIWLLDDSHFPSGYANGKIKDNPHLRKQILKQRVYDIVGPQTGVSIRIGNPLDKEETFYGAVLVSNNERIDVSECIDTGILYFDIEAEGVNKLIILTISHKSDFRDDYINVIDRDSCRLLIDEIYESHYKHFKNEFGKTIVGFFTDEPGFMNEKGDQGDSIIGKEMPLPWSVELEREWIKKYPIDYKVQLSKLWDREEETALQRYEYMDVVTKLYQKNFDEQIGEWCRKRGVMHIGHVIEDKECHSRLGVGAGHYFRALSGQDMAGVDIVINQLIPGIDNGYHSYGRGKWDMKFFNYALAKLGSSLAHVDPLKEGRTVAEVFGAFGWHEGLKLMKWIADHFLVRGVNYFVPHAFSQAKFPDFDCPPHFYAHGNDHQYLYFKNLMSYMNKMGTLLSGGKPCPTAAILYPAEAEWCGENMKIQDPASELSKHQIDFNFISNDVFVQTDYFHTEIDRNGLMINNIKYGCLILPYMEYIPMKVYQFIKKAKEYEFPVFFIDGYPSYIIETQEELSADDEYHVVSLNNLAQELRKRGLFDVQIDNEQPWLRIYHYIKGTNNYYMFFNEHPKTTIQTNVTNLKGVKFDLLNEESCVFNENLVLSPYESCVIFRDDTVQGEPYLYKDLFYIQGHWKLSYKGYPVNSKWEELGEITELTDLNRKYINKAGTYKYEIEFESEEIKNCQLVIEDAYEVVHIIIDEKDYGTRICPPYKFPIPDLSTGKHHLELEVLNTLDKSIIDIFSLFHPMEPSGVIGNIKIQNRKEI